MLLFVLAALTGCRRDDIQVYTVPRQAGSQGQQAGTVASGTEGARAIPSLQYTLPKGWEAVAPGEMRAASFRINGKDGKMADLGVVPLPGLMGRDLETVNRWRTSIGLKQITEEELPKVSEPVTVAGVSGQIYDLSGENPGSGDKTRILAAIVRHQGVAWFFKMNGDDEVVAEQKPAFADFLKSVSFNSQAQGAASPTELPASHPPIGSGTTAAAGTVAAAAEKPHWTVPPHWKEVDGGAFLVAKFTIGASGTNQAAVNVSSSVGEGGGVLGNVNRWRKQLGLPEVQEADLKTLAAPLEGAGEKAIIVDMSGTDARSGEKARMIAAVVPQPAQTWFYKLMGGEAAVEQEKETFRKFVQTANYAHDH